jgi:hypothetical protein
MKLQLGLLIAVMVMAILSPSLGVQLDKFAAKKDSSSIIFAKRAPRKTDAMMSKYLNSRQGQLAQTLDQKPVEHSENPDCQEHCVKCTSIIDCKRCETGYVLRERKCLEENESPSEGSPRQQGADKNSNDSKKYWLIWIFILVALIVVVGYLIWRCTKQNNAEHYQSQPNNDQKLFEMQDREKARHKNVTTHPKPTIVVNQPAEDVTKKHIEDQEVYTSVIIEQKQFGNTPPVTSKFEYSKPGNQSGKMNSGSASAGFDSFIPGNSPQPGKVIGPLVDDAGYIASSQVIARQTTADGFNMTKKVQPTELSPKDKKKSPEIAQFDPLVDSISQDNKQSPGSNSRSPKLVHEQASPETFSSKEGEVVTSQFFASQLPVDSKK